MSWLWILVSVVFTASPSMAQDVARHPGVGTFAAQTSDFATQFCTAAVPTTYNQITAETSATLSARWNNFITKLAGLGFKGEAKGKAAVTQSQGLLPKDVIEALKDATQCKLAIWNSLRDVFAEDLRARIASQSKEPPTKAPNVPTTTIPTLKLLVAGPSGARDLVQLPASTVGKIAALRLHGWGTWRPNVASADGSFVLKWGAVDSTGAFVSEARPLTFHMLPSGGQPGPVEKTDVVMNIGVQAFGVYVSTDSCAPTAGTAVCVFTATVEVLLKQ